MRASSASPWSTSRSPMRRRSRVGEGESLSAMAPSCPGTLDRMTLTVGVPYERKSDEHRVALTPDGVRELRRWEVPVLVEAGAGAASSIADELFAAAGAEIVPSAAEV